MSHALHPAARPHRADAPADGGLRLVRGLTVRPAAPADHAAVAVLLRDLELDYAGRDLGRFTVAESGGEVVGIAEVRDLGGPRLLSCVGVREDLQGGGLGRAVVTRALDGVEEDVWLYTRIPEFFAGLGFVACDAPPAQLPPRTIYGCEGCDPSRCRRMVRRGGHGLDRPRPLGFDDLDVVAAALAHGGEPTCDLSPAGLWIWRDCDAPSLATVEGALCIRIGPHHETPYFLEPLGAGDVLPAIEACFESGSVAAPPRVSRVRADLARRLPAARWDVTPLRDRFDYVCDVRSLAALRHAKHDGHRNRVRKFAREHPRHEVRALTAADRADALALFDRWGRGRGPGDSADAGEAAENADAAGSLPGRACQRRAVERAFDDFDRLRLVGGALVEDGALLGFLLGSRCGDTVVVHFLYADAALPGAYQTLVAASCRSLLADARWINLEEDLGIVGLRRMKLSWQPARLVEKFQVTRR